MAHVLILEDDPGLGLLYEEILTAEGYEVTCCLTGREALIATKANPPSLIIMDLSLPDMKGGEFHEQLQNLLGADTIPVLVISGSSVIAQEASRLNAASYLKKPVDLDDFVMTVGAILSCETES